ncbi:MAG: type II toxin-antitoxin system YafQ family toxin [Sulfuricellaceae bacterium]
MLKPVVTGAFKREYRLAMKRGKKIERIDAIIRLLIEEKPLDVANRDHALTGDWAPRRECHIEPDWLLVYKIDGDTIIFERTGTHSDLFR